jgi:hypothetical protein
MAPLPGVHLESGSLPPISVPILARPPVGAVRWLGFVPAVREELPESAAALVASQLDIDLSSIDPKRLHVERDARAEQLAQVMTISRFRACRDANLDELGSWVANRALGHDGPLALLRSAVDELRRRKLLRPGLTVLERRHRGRQTAPRVRAGNNRRPLTVLRRFCGLGVARIIGKDPEKCSDGVGEILETDGELGTAGGAAASEEALCAAERLLELRPGICGHGGGDGGRGALGFAIREELVEIGTAHTGRGDRRAAPGVILDRSNCARFEG